MPTTNMSTSRHSALLESALDGIADKRLRMKLITSYLGLKRGHAEGRFDLAGLNSGKFAEVAIRILQSHIFGKSTPLGQRITNFADECRRLVTSPSTAAPESLREMVPRALVFIYTLRNKRGIGHVGGDVDANKVDALTLVQVADWVICEFIRVYHGLSLEEAQAIVDALATRKLPVIWEVAGKKRVLKRGLSAAQEVLLLLYTDQAAVLTEDLFEWVEYSDFSLFRGRVLARLHQDRLIEYDKESELVHLSPLGVEIAERILTADEPH
jgi:hypothetical protein